MLRASHSRLAIVALLAATGLSCTDVSAPQNPASLDLAQSAIDQDPTLTPQTSGTTARLIGVNAAIRMSPG